MPLLFQGEAFLLSVYVQEEVLYTQKSMTQSWIMLLLSQLTGHARKICGFTFLSTKS